MINPQPKLPTEQVRLVSAGAWWWFLLFYFLSFKEKILGEIGKRPFYIHGMVAGVLLFIYFFILAKRKYNFSWDNFTQPSVLILLVILVCYLPMQALLYPTSMHAVLYSSVTVLLCFGISFVSIAAYGWLAIAMGVYFALLGYGILNAAIVGFGFIFPALIEYLPTSPTTSGFGIRISGLAGDPTHLGAYFSIALMLMFMFRVVFYRWWYPLVAFILFIGLLATGSRNAILSMAIGIIVGTSAGGHARKKWLYFAYLSAATALLVTSLYMVIPDSEIIFSALFRLDDENSYSRINIWRDMLEIAGSMSIIDLLLGGGYLFIQDIYGSPYNAFLRVFFNQGGIYLIGLLAILLVVFIVASNDNNRFRKSIVFSLFGYWLSFSIFLDTLHAEFFHITEFVFWFSAAIVVTSGLKVNDSCFRNA